jgi:hypothetical protein
MIKARQPRSSRSIGPRRRSDILDRGPVAQVLVFKNRLPAM